MKTPRPRYGWPPLSFRIGDKVKGRGIKVTTRARGKVTYANADGSYGVTWDNGSTSVNYPTDIERA